MPPPHTGQVIESPQQTKPYHHPQRHQDGFANERAAMLKAKISQEGPPSGEAAQKIGKIEDEGNHKDWHQDHQAAHGRGAHLRLVGTGAIEPDLLADAQSAQQVNQRTAPDDGQKERYRPQGQGEGHGG